MELYKKLVREGEILFEKGFTVEEKKSLQQFA